MKFWVVCALLCLWSAMTGCGNKTIDLLDGTYEGFFIEGDLDEKIVDVTDNDKLAITFFSEDVCEEDEEVDEEQDCMQLWAFIEFRGLITVETGIPLVGDVVMVGPEDDTIEGITVEGLDLKCKRCKLFKARRNVKGTFSLDLMELELCSEGIGCVPLELVVEDEDEEE